MHVWIFFPTSSATLQICWKFLTSLCHISLHKLDTVARTAEPVARFSLFWSCALFCSLQHPNPGPQVPWKCLCLHILPIPVWDLPLRTWDNDTSGATACSRHLSSGLFFQEDDEDEDSSSGVSDSDVLLQDGYERAETRPILSVRKYPVHAFAVSETSSVQCPSGLLQVEQDSSVHFTLNSTCSHPKVHSACEIRLIENSVRHQQFDKDLFLLGH